MRPGVLALALAGLAGGAASSQGQQIAEPSRAQWPAAPDFLAAVAARPAAPSAAAARPSAAPHRVLTTPAGAFAGSLVLPGAGQAALGQRRWPVYVALEAGFWWLWLDARNDFGRHRDGYRDLAWETARIREGPRREAGWSYYEAMSQYLESGLFDTDPAAGIQPEEDPSTYNGSVWEIARGIHLPGGTPDPGTPEHEMALSWYEARAAGPGFLWTWAGHEDDLSRFRALIASADDARRTQTTAVGVILANHLVSAIDALVAARLQAAGGTELNSEIVPGSEGPALRLELSIPLTN